MRARAHGPARQAESLRLFRTPSLRNVATRRVFFHNGAFRTLDAVRTFYAERDIHPEKWYPRNADGSVRAFDDVPPPYHGNVSREPPFDRQPGQQAALTPAEIADLIAFLATLTDGHRP